MHDAPSFASTLLFCARNAIYHFFHLKERGQTHFSADHQKLQTIDVQGTLWRRWLRRRTRCRNCRQRRWLTAEPTNRWHCIPFRSLHSIADGYVIVSVWTSWRFSNVVKSISPATSIFTVLRPIAESIPTSSKLLSAKLVAFVAQLSKGLFNDFLLCFRTKWSNRGFCARC